MQLSYFVLSEIRLFLGDCIFIPGVFFCKFLDIIHICIYFITTAATVFALRINNFICSAFSQFIAPSSIQFTAVCIELCNSNCPYGYLSLYHRPQCQLFSIQSVPPPYKQIGSANNSLLKVLIHM